MRDCEELSPHAKVKFDRLKPFFPPDPWDKPRWQEEGLVFSNGWLDLRKSADRKKLEEQLLRFIGHAAKTAASLYRNKRAGSLEGFEHEHYGPVIQQKAELLLLLDDLDFQIETYDLVED